MPHLFAMADIIVSRAGATTLFEILELRKPNLLIPLSTKASRGDQILNARWFAQQGFSKVLTEEDLTRDHFIGNIQEIYKNKGRYVLAMNKYSISSSTQSILNAILQQMK